MVARLLVLILASSLLGVAPSCRCEGQAKQKPQKASCGHCSSESTPKPKGCPIPDCCCVHEVADRSSEEAYVLPAQASTLDLDWTVTPECLPSLGDPAVPTRKVGGVLRQPDPPLHLLFRHLTI